MPGRRSRQLQRCYGWFRCKQCGRHWESSHVWRVVGTRIVPFKQACKKCHEAGIGTFFTGPYDTECNECGSDSCDCTNNYRDSDDDYDEETDYDSEDEEGRGRHIDRRKPHLAALCERCVKGLPCRASPCRC